MSITNYDAEETFVGGAHDIYTTDDPDVPFPTTVEGEIDAGWLHLGFTTENGVKLPGLKRTITPVKAAQAFFPIREIVSDITSLVEFELLQWNTETFLLANGGGSFEAAGGGVKFTPPAESFIDTRRLLIHTVDGETITRWGWPRVVNTKDFDSSFVRTAASTLPIGMSVLDPGDDPPYFFITNDPAFALGS